MSKQSYLSCNKSRPIRQAQKGDYKVEMAGARTERGEQDVTVMTRYVNEWINILIFGLPYLKF